MELPLLPADWASKKPGAVSANLSRLRVASGFNSRDALADAAGISNTTLRRFETETEPPANHPLLHKVASAMARKTKQSVDSVLEELKKGGKEYDIPVKIKRMMTNQKRTKRNKSDTPVKLVVAREVPLSHDARSVAQRARRVKEGTKHATKTHSTTKHTTKRAAKRQQTLDAILNDPIRLARTMTDTYNTQALAGDGFITIPMAHFRPVLEVYLDRHDIPSETLLPSDYEDMFP